MEVETVDAAQRIYCRYQAIAGNARTADVVQPSWTYTINFQALMKRKVSALTVTAAETRPGFKSAAAVEWLKLEIFF